MARAHVRYLGSIPACAGEPTPRTGGRPASRVYPRVCGGADICPDLIFGYQGLSPRVRGSRPRVPWSCPVFGSIPACAGEPPRSHAPRPGRRVYPRVCGGAPEHGAALWREWGLSPRVRGSPSVVWGASCRTGSIPACAGEPTVNPWPRPIRRVYPRVCGGAAILDKITRSNKGLSPRVRGSRPPRIAH